MTQIDQIKAEIERLKSKYYGLATAEAINKTDCYCDILSFINSLPEEQPDNEDIDEVAHELYEHLYELKRRNNVPTNLYDKQEIIDLWKAGIEYGRTHSKQEQPSEDLEKAAQRSAILKYQMPENGDIDKVGQVMEARIFHEIGYIAGWKACKEQMLKKAVEGVAEELYNDGESQCTVGVGTYFKPGEEVYVIKKEDKK